ITVSSTPLAITASCATSTGQASRITERAIRKAEDVMRYVETTLSPVAVRISVLRFSPIRKELHARRDNRRPFRTPSRAASRRREPAGVPRLHDSLGNRGGVPPQAPELDSGAAGHLLWALRYPDDRVIAGGDRRARRRASLGRVPLGAGRLCRRLARFPVHGRSPAHERHRLWPDA